MIPDWQLPNGVDRGLWDYLHAAEMVRRYDEQMAASPLAAADVRFCERVFPTPCRLIDLGCGTGRLAIHFARRGFACIGVDLSEEMLAVAQDHATTAGVRVEWRKANLVDLGEFPDCAYDSAACLFSTLGMIRGEENRMRVIANAFRLLKPGGRFVLHVHNRYFRGLGWSRVLGQYCQSLLGSASAGDIAMPQSYGGAPLTLHHFTRREAVQLLERTGFKVKVVQPVGKDGEPAWPMWRVYGWLIESERNSP